MFSKLGILRKMENSNLGCCGIVACIDFLASSSLFDFVSGIYISNYGA